MKSSKQYKLEGKIDVDEFEIGTPKKDQQGRSYSTDKIRIVIAVENRDGKSGRAYAQTIMDFSIRSLGKILKPHIAKNTEVRSDGWTGYNPLKEEYPHLTQELSNKEMNFQMLLNQIRDLKNG
jgi:hypothetical protein